MKIDFAKGGGLVPAIVQDEATGTVLMLGYMNEAAWQRTQETGKVTFFSRSKQRLWEKGESSGNQLQFIRALVDCDADTLLVFVRPIGPTCHTGSDSCFGLKNQSRFGFLLELERIIVERKLHPSEGSYTSSLFAKGLKKIAQKVGEEGVEVALEGALADPEKLKEETADLLYHLLVLLAASDLSFEDVCAVLAERNKL